MEDELILANGLVLSLDGERGCGRRSLLLRGGNIVEIADSSEELLASAPSATVLDLSGKIVVPGFVNAHFHGESALFRDLTEGRLFREWSSDPLLEQAARRLIDPARRALLVDLWRVVFASHLKSGTTTAAEYPPSLDGPGLELIDRESVKAGIRLALVLQNWDHVEWVKGKPELLQRCALSLGDIQDFTVYTLDTRVQAARELGIPLAVQWGETGQEAEYFRKSFGKNMLELLREHDALGAGSRLIHLNYGSAADFRLAQSVGATVTLAPRSAAEKGTGYPALRHLRSYRGVLALGSDWGSADMMAEIKFLRQLPSLLPGTPLWTSLELLKMATINGARALGLSEEAGSIEPGKRADLVVFTPEDVRASGPEDAADADSVADYIVRRLDSRHISDVIAGGKFRLRGGVLAGFDESQLREQLQRLRSEIIGAQALERRRRVHAQPQAKIIPFLSVPKGALSEELPSEEQAGRVREAKKVPREEKTVRPDPGRLAPELPKNVKRVFGEEEDL